MDGSPSPNLVGVRLARRGKGATAIESVPTDFTAIEREVRGGAWHNEEVSVRIHKGKNTAEPSGPMVL